MATTKIVIVDQDRRVLLENQNGVSRLPEMLIPRFSRTTRVATHNARNRWNLDLFVSLKIESDRTTTGSRGEEILICRLTRDSTQLPQGFDWSDNIKQLNNADQLTVITAWRQLDLQRQSLSSASAFTQYDALDRLRHWYGPYLAGMGLREVGVQHWHSGGGFALIRIEVQPLASSPETSLKALWFKAVGEPNTRELPVTVALAETMPSFLPRLVATNPAWNGWLMEEVSGHLLAEDENEATWRLTAAALAKVQRHFLNKDAELLALGCRDWRASRVLFVLDAFFESMEESMRSQPVEPPRRLSAIELRSLKLEARELCHRVEDLGVPYGLAHGDFSPNNVIISNGSPILIDWAESYVTFPFISWEYFRNRMVKDHPDQADWQRRMEEDYTREWLGEFNGAQVRACLELSPAMAVLVAALNGIDQPSPESMNPARERVRRSLVRRLQRELRLMRTVSAP